MSIKDQPAFPIVTPFAHEGLTKREWLAGLAMQGILANPRNEDMNSAAVAGFAVSVADLLLMELDLKP